MCEESWRDCCAWLTRVGLITSEHRANSPNATVKDLAYNLRDGVQICRLLNLIQPNSLDLKDISQKPQMAQVIQFHFVINQLVHVVLIFVTDVAGAPGVSNRIYGRGCVNNFCFSFSLFSFFVCGIYVRSYKFAKMYLSSRIRTYSSPVCSLICLTLARSCVHCRNYQIALKLSVLGYRKLFFFDTTGSFPESANRMTLMQVYGMYVLI